MHWLPGKNRLLAFFVLVIEKTAFVLFVLCWDSLDNIAIDSTGTLFLQYFPSTASVLAAKEKIPPELIREGKERYSLPLTSKKTPCPYIFPK